MDNMRIDYIMNNKYKNNLNNFDDIGLKTMPNFGNNINNFNINNSNGFNFNKTNEIKTQNNFAKTSSIFNSKPKKLNADEYFEKLNKEIQEKRKEIW